LSSTNKSSLHSACVVTYSKAVLHQLRAKAKAKA
jgi:hypothetical protein